MNEQPVYVLHLVALADDIPPEVRLRALLKTALRRDRLRCVKALRIAATAAGAPETAPDPFRIRSDSSPILWRLKAMPGYRLGQIPPQGGFARAALGVKKNVLLYFLVCPGPCGRSCQQSHRPCRAARH
jgi:hypothetical protein